jgi:hypothetical protein
VKPTLAQCAKAAANDSAAVGAVDSGADSSH